MLSVNMADTRSELASLVGLIERNEQDIIYIVKDGVNVAQITPATNTSRRLGIAKGKFTVPDDFDEMDKEIEDMFEGY